MTPTIDPNQEPRSAQEITSSARSNLALTLRLLPWHRRLDLTVFYAFCRIIDDLADDEGLKAEEKLEGLNNWRELIQSNDDQEARGLARSLIELKNRHHINDQHLLDLIDGCQSDIKDGQRFGTWDNGDRELKTYTYQVASAVGLVCLHLFGVANPQHPDCQNYALNLGHALQLTNIIRDVGTDLNNGHRIYLPLADLNRFQYTERDLIGRVHDGRFIHLMSFEAERARHFYQEAESSFQKLTRQDRKALLPSRAMHRIYSHLLDKIEADRFQVFNHEYRLNKAQKIAHLAKAYFAS